MRFSVLGVGMCAWKVLFSPISAEGAGHQRTEVNHCGVFLSNRGMRLSLVFHYVRRKHAYPMSVLHGKLTR